jgi:hypothetical protein
MARQKRIYYGIDEMTGLVFSRFEGQIAVPVIAFDEMKPEDNFEIKTNLEKFPHDTLRHMQPIFTRKIPLAIKNEHRIFWGLKPLKERING